MNQKQNILNVIHNENIEKIYKDNFKNTKIKDDNENNKNNVLKNNNNILSKKLNLKKNFGNNITNKIVNEMYYKTNNIQKNEIKNNKENNLIILSKRNLLFINNNIKDKLLLGEEKKYLNNPQYLIDYSHEILNNLNNDELINIPDYKNIKINHPLISNILRRKIIQQIFFIQFTTDLKDETVYLAINLIDRYLSINKTFSKNNFILLSYTCLYLAEKFEEIYYNDLFDFIYLAKKSNSIFTAIDMIHMEYNILKSLNYDILTVYPIHFLNKYFLILNDPKEVYFLAQFYLELSLSNLEFIKLKSSLKASCCLFLARKFNLLLSEKDKIKRSLIIDNNIWTRDLCLITGYKLNHLKCHITLLLNIIKDEIKNYKIKGTNEIFKKFKSKKYLQVASKFI